MNANSIIDSLRAAKEKIDEAILETDRCRGAGYGKRHPSLEHVKEASAFLDLAEYTIVHTDEYDE